MRQRPTPSSVGSARTATRSGRSRTTHHAGSEPSSARWRFVILAGWCARIAIRAWTAPLRRRKKSARSSDARTVTADCPTGKHDALPAGSPGAGRVLPIEPTETYATVRKRAIRIGERLDNQIIRETWKARAQAYDRSQLEMQLPGDGSIDTAHIRSADPNAARNFELVIARCGRRGRGEPGGRYFVTGSTAPQAIRDRAPSSSL